MFSPFNPSDASAESFLFFPTIIPEEMPKPGVEMESEIQQKKKWMLMCFLSTSDTVSEISTKTHPKNPQWPQRCLEIMSPANAPHTGEPAHYVSLNQGWNPPFRALQTMTSWGIQAWYLSLYDSSTDAVS